MNSVLGGKIILIQTGATLLSKEFSSFVGSYLLNMVRKAIYLQGGKPPSERRPVTIFIDESQRLQGADYGLMLAEIAKFGGNVILTTQGMDSIGRATASDEMDDPQAFSKIMDNTDTLFVFRMSGINAKKMADTDFWGETTPTDLINLDKYHAFVRFSKKRSVQGPFEVALAAPLEPNETTRTRILSLRENYLKTREQADISARESLCQVEDYYFKGEKAMFTNIEPPDIIKEKVDAVKSVNEIGSAIQTVDIQPDEIEDMLSALGEINIAPRGADGKN